MRGAQGSPRRPERVLADRLPEVRFDLGAEVVLREILDGVDVGIAGVVDENVQPAEGVDCCLDRRDCLRAVGHVEAHCPSAVRIALDEVLKLVRISGCGDDVLAGGQRRLGQGTADAAGASGDEPSTGRGFCRRVRRVETGTGDAVRGTHFFLLSRTCDTHGRRYRGVDGAGRPGRRGCRAVAARAQRGAPDGSGSRSRATRWRAR